MLTAPSEAALRNGWKLPHFSPKMERKNGAPPGVPGAYLRIPSLVMTVL
jgi:hypothetical protein